MDKLRFKKAINTACDAWMRNHPAKTMTIYDKPSIISTAMPLAFTQANIQAGFRKTGIFPFNRNLFQEIDFAPSFVTDRPNPNVTEEVATPSQQNIEFGPDNETPSISPSLLNPDNAENRASVEETVLQALLTYEASTLTSILRPAESDEIGSQLPMLSQMVEAHETRTLLRQDTAGVNHGTLNLEPCNSSPDAALLQHLEPLPSTSNQSAFSPEAIRPYPKASSRKKGNRGRKTKKSAIYTDSPVKEAVRKEYEERQKRLKNKQTKKNVLEPSTGKINKGKGKGKGKAKHKKVVTPLESSEEEEYYCILCLESYSNSRSGEKWVQCQGGCRLWSHVACTDGSRYFICQNCSESD